MLFNSFEFIFLFLPIAAFTFFLFAKQSKKMGAVFLTVISLVFYSCWETSGLKILIPSIITNFIFAKLIERFKLRPTLKKDTLKLAVILNLLLLFYFKYSNFFLQTFSLKSNESNYYLPLGISFFTFTQIAYLVDLYRDEAKPFSGVHFGLFVTYFPHLISGPILHHAEMRPQFNSPYMYRFKNKNLMIGMTLFILGLFKKVVLADSVAQFVSPTFSSQFPQFFAAWGAALSYSLQIYFDFSGYSDMAIGISKILGINLPINFNSPYRSPNIIQFWRRWHITLSRFLRDYLYIPLGGSKKGQFRRYLNLYLTMLLGGLWHGAGWTFIIWGGLHGVYLILNHGWQRLRGKNFEANAYLDWFGHKITFLCVVIAWVFFRANSFQQAKCVIRGMAGRNGYDFSSNLSLTSASETLWIFSLTLIVWCSPNTQEWMGKFNPGILEYGNETSAYRDRYVNVMGFRLPTWTPSICALILIVILMGISVGFMKISPSKEFIYYNF